MSPLLMFLFPHVFWRVKKQIFFQMYCPFCGTAAINSADFCCQCGRNIKFVQDHANKAQDESNTTTATPDVQPSTSTGVKSFMNFRAVKERERKTFFTKKHQNKTQKGNKVKINVGLMRMQGDSLKTVRGKLLPIEIHPEWASEQVLAAAVKKQKDFNIDLRDCAHVLLYPDAREVKNIPGTDIPFTVQKYKEAIGKPYQRITLYICPVEDFAKSCFSGQSSSDDDSVVHVRLPSQDSPLSDTVVWDGPDEASTPTLEKILNGPSGHTEQGSDQDGGNTNVQEHPMSSEGQNPFYRNYTNLYAPIIVDSDSEPDEYVMQFPEQSTDNVTAADIISELSAMITSSSLSRFNINRANVWDGALRGFKRASFNPFNDIFVKFTDDEGQAEDGVDNGGPKREFLSLLMNCLRTRRVFDGPEERKFITFDSEAAKNDEYFLVGRMIATSVVHGGPGPQFLSEKLYQHLTGTSTNTEGKIEDITDNTMRASLIEISSAGTLTELHQSVERHASILQTAGCLQFPVTVDDKLKIVKEFIDWYIIYRNHFSIQRFKDGLSTLNFQNALEQHAFVFRPFMCARVEQLTSKILEEIFEVQLSEKGSSRRHEETRVLGFWRDFLLDTEEQKTGLSLQDILMFATGLNTLPPSSILPPPKLIFQATSRFPVSSTCSNTIKIPMSKTYHQFKEDMDFGIQNSPGFGLY
ncbi:G2/M phase-specific E3 ubiquitin-protein ligase-like isoform 3-T3 [Menidia menidia]